MHSEDATALEMVRKGYALDDPTDRERVLTFRVAFNDRENAYAALEAIGDYNDFNGSAVANALRGAIRDRSTRITVGREGSPVVYVSVWGEDGEAIQDALWDAKADEVDPDRHRDIRAWWD